MNRRLLITGAGGFLGSRICEYFSGRDGYEAVGVTHRELDIEDFVAVSAFVKAIRPDYVLHCAAISNTGACERNPVLSEKVNVRGRQSGQGVQESRQPHDIYQLRPDLQHIPFPGAQP